MEKNDTPTPNLKTATELFCESESSSDEDSEEIESIDNTPNLRREWV